MKVKIRKLTKRAVIPQYAKEGDAGMDLVATHIIEHTSDIIVYGTGLCVEIPSGHVGLLFPRSSIRRLDMLMSNSVGVVDSGYRGEIQCSFKKVNGFYDLYKVGDRVAQLIILPYPTIEFEEVDELSETARGDGGHGSTGK